MRRLRNDDFREVVLQAQGRPALRFAAAYGFRNIQTLVRKIKRRACEYDFVEIMACPSACLNGGGQLRPTEVDLPPTSCPRHDSLSLSQWQRSHPDWPPSLNQCIRSRFLF